MRISIHAFALVLLAGVPARADTPEGKRLAAEALFSEGRHLMEAGDFEHACPKLRDSHDLDPGLGTLLNLAVCYEKSGKTASAWTRYKDVLALARTSGDGDRERLATERIAAIEPGLAKLRLRVRTTTPALSLACDEIVLPETLWSSDVPIDVGTHTIRATARDHVPWSSTINVENASTTVVEVPELALVPPPAPVVVATLPRETPNRWRVPLSWGLAGAGVVAVTIGALTSGVAVAKFNESRDYCMGNQCQQHGLDLRGSALSFADAATVSFIAAGTLIAGSAIVWFFVPAMRKTSLALSPSFLF